jgi:TorA maturation chaperone TorD
MLMARLSLTENLEAVQNSDDLGFFWCRLARSLEKKRACRKCKSEYPVSWFYPFHNTVRRNESPTFWKGKWYPARLAICRLCKCADVAAFEVCDD